MSVRGIGVGLGILTMATIALAQSPERRAYRVSVTVPSGCTDVFTAALRAQTRNVELSSSSAASPLRVRVTATPNGFHGDLDLEMPDASPVQRTLEGATCAEVQQGLALVVAVTLDPPPEAAELDASADSAAIPLAPPPAAPVVEVNASEPTPRAPSNFTFVVGGNSEVTSIIGSGSVLFGGFGEFGWRGTGPRFRLRFGASLPAEQTSRSGLVTVSWLSGTLDACPIGFDLSTHVALRPCAGWTVGKLHARGRGAGVAVGDERDRLWTAARGSLFLWGDLGPFTWGIGGGAIVPVLRETLVFQPPVGMPSGNESVYEVPGIAAFGGIDLGVRFP